MPESNKNADFLNNYFDISDKNLHNTAVVHVAPNIKCVKTARNLYSIGATMK
jgi:hypothetical protein